MSHWEEVDHNKSAYIQFQKQMSLEVAAACEGAIAAGAKEILVKDAHYSGRNILRLLPPLVITDDDVTKSLDILDELLTNEEGRRIG